MSNPSSSTSSSAAQPKLSQEPHFISVDLNGSEGIAIPSRASGLLAFLYVEGDSELVIKILMLDNLAKGFVDNLPFSGRANSIAYCVFPEVTDFDLRIIALNDRLKLYARLTEKYNIPQRNWALGGLKKQPPP